MTQNAHTITIETRQPDTPGRYVDMTRYRPVCSCGRYRGAFGWTLHNARDRGRAHVDRAKAADARRAGIIAGAIGAPVVGKNRPGRVGRYREEDRGA